MLAYFVWQISRAPRHCLRPRAHARLALKGRLLAGVALLARSEKKNRFNSRRCSILCVLFFNQFTYLQKYERIKAIPTTPRSQNILKRPTLFIKPVRKSRKSPLKVTMKVIRFLFTFAVALGFASATRAGGEATLAKALRRSAKGGAELTEGSLRAQARAGVSSSLLPLSHSPYSS